MQGKYCVCRNLRNQVVNIIRKAKEKYYQDIFETSKGNKPGNPNNY